MAEAGQRRRDASATTHNDNTGWGNPGRSIHTKAISSAVITMLLAVAGGAAFLSIGIRKANQQSYDSFENRAFELVRLLETTWKDYEYVTLSAHNLCRRERNTTRQEFRDFYLYLLAEGLEFESIQCSPNVTHADRERYETEAKNFYEQHYPTVNYSGIIGFIPDPVDEDNLIVVPSPDLDFYFPVHYLEPVLPNAPAIELDMYSYPSQKNEIDLAVTSREPVLSKRLNVVQENEEFAWSVIVYHPGIVLEDEDPETMPLDLSLILVRIPSLLERVSIIQEENLAVYLYDTTMLNTNGTPEFLGAGKFWIYDDKESDDPDAPRIHELELIDELELHEFYDIFENSKLYEEEIRITPSGTWQVLVVPIDESYDPQTAYVVFGGCMIMAAGIFLSIWYFASASKESRLSKLRVEAESERAALVVKNAEKIAHDERDLK